MAKLPSPKLVIPREKPVPQTKPLTRWEKFAKEKGIKKKKKSKMEYDEATGEYKPTWGYKSKSQEAERPWCIEVPQNAGNGSEGLRCFLLLKSE
jgi:regulator of ribosome biosynthesis